MNEAEFSQFAEKYRNWGRWGDMDEAGTLNFVTSERIIEAAGHQIKLHSGGKQPLPAMLKTLQLLSNSTK